MRKIYILDTFRPEVESIFKNGISYTTVWVKKNPNKGLKKNLYYLLTAIVLKNGDLAIALRYPNKEIYSQFLSENGFEDDFKKITNKILDFAKGITKQDNIEDVILSLNDNLTNPRYFTYTFDKPYQVELLHKDLPVFKMNQYPPLYQYEPQVLTPQQVEEYAIELSQKLTQSLEQQQDENENNLDNTTTQDITTKVQEQTKKVEIIDFYDLYC
jgi:hypothetical protein